MNCVFMVLSYNILAARLEEKQGQSVCHSFFLVQKSYTFILINKVIYCLIFFVEAFKTFSK